MAASYTQVFNKYSVEGFPGVCTVWGFSKRLYALKIELQNAPRSLGVWLSIQFPSQVSI